MIQEGDLFPDLKFVDDQGNPASVSDYRGRKVILYAYPKDNTPGCTQESCDFRDNIKAIEEKNAVVLGVSKDSAASKAKFKAKHELPFPLLADEDNSALEALGLWKDKNMYGKKVRGIERTTFLIDENGRVERIWRKVKVSGHVEEVLAAL